MSLSPRVSERVQTVWPAACAAWLYSIRSPTRRCSAATPKPFDQPVCGAVRDPPRRPLADLFAAVDRTLPSLGPAGACRLPSLSTRPRLRVRRGAGRGAVRMKHGGRRFLARRLARLLVPTLAELLARASFAADDLVVPVPLHPTKLRDRGFNQSSEMARAALRSRAPHLGRAAPAVRTSPPPAHAADARAGPRGPGGAARRGGGGVRGARRRPRARSPRGGDRRRLHHRRDVQRVRGRVARRRRRRGARSGASARRLAPRSRHRRDRNSS